MVDVFVNGVKFVNGTDFTATDGTTVVMAAGLAAGNIVEIDNLLTAYLPTNALRTITTFTATAGQSAFSVSYTQGLIDVFYNGSCLAQSEYIAINGTSVTLVTACQVNDIVVVYAYSYSVGAYSGIGGSGTTNYVSKFSSSSAISNSVLFDNGTNIGLGTTSPNIGGYGANSRLLTIQGVSGSYGILELTSNSANADGSAIGRLDFGSDGQAANYKAISSIASFLSGSTSTKFGADLRFYTRADNAGTGDPVERMRITSAGYVLIGATTSTGAGASRLQITGSAAQLLVSNTTSTGHIALYSTGVDAYITKNTASGNMYFGLAPQDGSSFTGQMTITSNGSINIETTTAFLQWQGGNYWTWRTVTSGTEFWLYRGDTGASPLIMTTGNVLRLSSLAGAGSRTVTADASGNLSASSDSSLKQEDTTHKIEGLAEILQLKPRAYKWLSDIEIRGEEATTEIGFFADEVNPIIPSAAPKGNDDLYGFYDRAVIAALVKAIQEMNTKIIELEKIVVTK
jgi:hypothetical protein